MTDDDKKWNVFQSTGKIEDYLAYKGCESRGNTVDNAAVSMINGVQPQDDAAEKKTGIS